MKKILLFIAILSISVMMCACSEQENTETIPENSTAQFSQTDSNTLVYEAEKNEASQGTLIERDGSEKQVSAPEGSISIDEAIEILDSCNYEDLYLPESVSSYEKYYFDTVTYNGSEYYSIDFCLESNGKRIFVGTNCIVACDGSQVLKKTWASDYLSVKPNTSDNDKDVKEVFGDVKSTPNDAFRLLLSLGETKLGLDHNLSIYTFEADSEIHEIKSIKCYEITPKLNYNNSISMLSPYYVTVDGSNRVFIKDEENKDSFIEIK